MPTILGSLELNDNQIGDDGMKSVASALAGGALAQLVQLFLNTNQIGDAGLTALASACASGALEQCTKIALDANPAASREAKKAVMDVLKQR